MAQTNPKPVAERPSDISHTTQTVAIVTILCVAFFFMGYAARPSEPQVSQYEPVPGSAHIAVHLYGGHWVAYNGSFVLRIYGGERSAQCRNGWFVTALAYSRGTCFTVDVNGTLFHDEILQRGDFATWHGEQWPEFIGVHVWDEHYNITDLLAGAGV